MSLWARVVFACKWSFVGVPAICWILATEKVSDGQTNKAVQDIVASIEKYESSFPNSLKGRIESKFQGFLENDKFLQQQSIFVSAQTGGCRTMWIVDESTREEAVYCANSQYRFEIKRNSNSGDKWSLTFLDYEPRTNPDWFAELSTTTERNDFERRIMWLPSPNTVYSVRLIDVISSPGFDVISISNDENGNRLVNATFPLLDASADGSFLFSSNDNKFLECDLRVHVPDDMDRKYTRRIHYDTNNMPTGIVQKTTFDQSGELIDEWEGNFFPDDVRQKNVSDFRLSFFGLPEPDGVRWGWPPAVWISIAGILLLGIVAWRRSRRSETA